MSQLKILSLEHVLCQQKEQASGSVNPPASFVCTEGFGQPRFQVLPAKEFITHEYGTWPAGTWLPILQAENPFSEGNMGQTSEVVEPPAEFEYARDYGQRDYDQPMFKVLPAKEIITYYYGPEHQALGCPHCTETTHSMVTFWDKCCQGTFSTHQNVCG